MASPQTSSDPRGGGALPAVAALVAALPVFTVLVYVPANIYLGNQAHFDFQYTVALHLAGIHAAFTLLLYLVFRIGAPPREAAIVLLGAVGLFLLLRASLAGAPVDALLDGRIGEVRESWRGAMVDLLLVAGLWLLLRKVSARTLTQLGAWFAVLAALAVPVVVVVEHHRQPESVTRWVSGGRAPPEPVSRGPNVYHLVFDGFDGSLAPLIVERLRLGRELAGFVNYRTAYANYTSTRLSFPSFMTGKMFDSTITDESGGRFGRREGLIETLSRQGYTTTQYNTYFVNNHELTHLRHSSGEIETASHGNLRQLVQLLDLSILTVLPTGLKLLGARQGRGVVSHWLWSEEPSLADWSRNPPRLSLMLFDRMMREEPSRPATGQYVNAHFLLPHAPHVLSATCAFEPERTDSRATLVEQAACTLRKIAAFAQQLRNLGRYRDSLILVHADHGTLHRDRPMLMAKYPGRSTEPFEIADHPVQLLDVVPTIHASLRLPAGDLPGAPLWDASKDARQEIKVWEARPDD